jgi:hypothetical protein
MATYTYNPTSNTTPDPAQGGVAVTGNTNTGHASTAAIAVDATSQTKSCLWTGFPAAAGQILSVTLKVDFIQNGTLSDGGAATSNQFRVQYSLNGGGAFSSLRDVTQITSSTSGTDSLALSVGQDLTQVQVRDKMVATSVAGESATAVATVSNIRIVVVTVDATVISMM